MKEVKDYSPSKDARLINCKTKCGNERCFAKRYGLFAEKTCHNFVEPKPITNADRIRAMSAEELAMLIHDIVQAEMWRAQVRECITTETGWLDWLREEVSTNG